MGEAPPIDESEGWEDSKWRGWERLHRSTRVKGDQLSHDETVEYSKIDRRALWLAAALTLHVAQIKRFH
jgi:hypothetical protein